MRGVSPLYVGVMKHQYFHCNEMRETRGPPAFLVTLEESEFVLGVADKKILCLLVVIKHHLVVLAADTG